MKILTISAAAQGKTSAGIVCAEKQARYINADGFMATFPHILENALNTKEELYAMHPISFKDQFLIEDGIFTTAFKILQDITQLPRA